MKQRNIMLASLTVFAALLSFLLLGSLVLSPALNAQESNGGRPVAIFETTNGTFEAELYTDLAPVTAGNFIKLAKDGYYDGTVFHRVIDSFMIHGGDPTGTGTGGPGYVIEDEFGPGLAHTGPGILSMANSGKNTGGSQFFVTLVPTPWLDGKHAIFGAVTKGLDIVEAIGKVPTGKGDRPLTEVRINRLSISEPHEDEGKGEQPPMVAE